MRGLKQLVGSFFVSQSNQMTFCSSDIGHQIFLGIRIYVKSESQPQIG